MLNVFENLHRAIAKPSLTKLLDKLVDKYVFHGSMESTRCS